MRSGPALLRPAGWRTLGLTLASVLLLLAGRSMMPAQEAGSLDGREEDPSAGAAGLTVILSSESGEAVTGGSVRLQGAWRPDGSFDLAEVGPGRYAGQALPPGRFVLLVSALGYEEARLEVEVDAADSQIAVVLGVRPVAVSDLVAAVEETEGPRLPGHAVSRIQLDSRPRSLGDRLAEEPGVQVRRSAGGREVGSVRGSRSEALLVLLDGLPVNDPVAGSADLSRIPVATLASATLVRGASARFGSGAIGGVLLLESRKPDGWSRAAGAEVGSFGRLAADGYASLGGELGTLALGVRAEGVENDFEYVNRALSERPSEVRQNADAGGLHLWLSAAPSALPIFVQARYDDVERGAPGRMGTQVFDEARYRDRSVQAVLGYGSTAGRVSGIAAWRDLFYRDARRGFESVQSLSSLRLVGSTWMPAAAVQFSGYLAREAVAGSETEGGPVRWSGGVWVGRSFDVGRLAIQPGLAADLSTDGSAVSPELSLAAQLGPRWVIWGRAGQAYRLPTFTDLYAPASRGVRANPDLRAERVVIDAEAGVRWTSASGVAGPGGVGGIDLQGVAFYRETHDPIVWVASGAALWSPLNLDRLTAVGIEVRAGLPLFPGGPRAGGAVTLQHSRLGFGTNRNPMPYQPNLAGDFHLVGEVAGAWLRGSVSVVGSRTTTLAGVRRLPAYTLLRIDASRGVRIGSVELEAGLSLDNLLDVRYELTELFPEPGRSIAFRLEVR